MKWNDEFLYKYKATIAKVLDGDTIHVNLDIGMHTTMLKTCRLLRADGSAFDAPEIKLYRGVTPQEKAAGLLVKAEAERIFPIGSEIRLISHKDKGGKYGRLLITPYFYEGGNWHDYVEYIINWTKLNTGIQS